MNMVVQLCKGQEDPYDCTTTGTSKCGNVVFGINITTMCPIMCDACDALITTGPVASEAMPTSSAPKTGAIAGSIAGVVVGICLFLVARKLNSNAARVPEDQGSQIVGNETYADFGSGSTTASHFPDFGSEHAPPGHDAISNATYASMDEHALDEDNYVAGGELPADSESPYTLPLPQYAVVGGGSGGGAAAGGRLPGAGSSVYVADGYDASTAGASVGGAHAGSNSGVMIYATPTLYADAAAGACHPQVQSLA